MLLVIFRIFCLCPIELFHLLILNEFANWFKALMLYNKSIFRLSSSYRVWKRFTCQCMLKMEKNVSTLVYNVELNMFHIVIHNIIIIYIIYIDVLHVMHLMDIMKKRCFYVLKLCRCNRKRVKLIFLKILFDSGKCFYIHMYMYRILISR